MAVVIRFARRGAKKNPFYRIVAADKECPRDGRYLEVLGTYNPKDKTLKVDSDRVKYWHSKGAKTSDTVGQLLAKNVSV